MRNPSSRNSLTQGCYESAFSRLCQKTQQPKLSDLDVTAFQPKGPRSPTPAPFLRRDKAADQVTEPVGASESPPRRSSIPAPGGIAGTRSSRGRSWLPAKRGALLSRSASTEWHLLGLECHIPSDRPRGDGGRAVLTLRYRVSTFGGKIIKRVHFEVTAMRGC